MRKLPLTTTLSPSHAARHLDVAVAFAAELDGARFEPAVALIER